MLTNVHLNFDFAQLLDADYTAHSGSCIKHQVYELTDIHDAHGGFPKSYCLENTKIHQLWWDNTQVDYEELGKQLGMEVVTVSTIMQEPGCVVPLHRDIFYQIGLKHPTRNETKVRANIYMEDYKLGHFIQYQKNDTYESSTNWVAGDGFLWNNEVLHLSANAGMSNKYTMQVSGFLI